MRNHHLTIRFCLAILPLFFVGAGSGAAASPSLTSIAETSGCRGGLLVIVGGGTFDVDEAVGLSSRFVVHCLDADPERVRRNREAVQARGLYGQIIVEHWTGRELPYLDNLVTLAVTDGIAGFQTAEYRRVLRPGGKLCEVGGKGLRMETKPWPEGMDQWTHQWYRPHGNLLSADRLAGVPTGFQWLMAPTVVLSGQRFSGTQSLITDDGRVFFITMNDAENIDNGTAKYFLIARDAFNGLFLWKRPWVDSNKIFAGSEDVITAVSCPKIVADKERLYITEGKGVLSLNAATGEVLQHYACEGMPQALLYEDGKLVVESDKGVVVLDPVNGRRLWAYETRGVPNEAKAEKPRQQWRLETPGIISTMISHGKVCFLERCRDTDGKGQHDEVVCLDFGTGRELWRKSLQGVKIMASRRSVKICFVMEKVLGLVDENVFTALSMTDGRELWSQSPGNSAKWWTYHRFAGHFFKDNQIWLHMKDTAYDPESQESWSVFEAETGKRVREFESRGKWPACENPGKEGCASVVATDRYIMYPRQSTWIDFQTGEKHHNAFFRGSCVLGSVPANGMYYVAPEACACFSESVRGFLATVARPGIELMGPSKAEDRHLQGPAWKSVSGPAPGTNDWPQYRYDASRSAATVGDLPADLTERWAVPVAGNAPCRSRTEWGMRMGYGVTAPVVAEGKVFVAAPDSHQVMALDARTGAKLWQFTADGRIDTPPAIFRGLCLFGSHDGRVYCLRVSDGALVWRFLAAPNDRRMIAFGQPESVWPVAGSVLIHSGLVFAAAGRSLNADGGIFLTALDPASGKQVWRKNFKDGHGGQCDILTSDEKSIYLAGLDISPLTGDEKPLYRVGEEIDAHLGTVKPSKGAERFLVSSHYGLSDATWTRNVLSRRKGMQSWRYRGVRGLLLAFSGDGVAGFDNTALTKDGRIGDNPSLLRYTGRSKEVQDWAVSLPAPLQVDALALSSGTLLAAGPFEGPRIKDKRGFLFSYSTKDGKKLSESILPSVPVFDGLAVAYNRVYLAMADGTLRCFGRRDE